MPDPALGLAIFAMVLSVVALALHGNHGEDSGRMRLLEMRIRRVEDQLGIPPDPVDPDVLAQLIAGNKIAAIKIYRERTGLGLKEAKDAVEEIARERGLA